LSLLFLCRSRSLRLKKNAGMCQWIADITQNSSEISPFAFHYHYYSRHGFFRMLRLRVDAQAVNAFVPPNELKQFSPQDVFIKPRSQLGAGVICRSWCRGATR